MYCYAISTVCNAMYIELAHHMPPRIPNTEFQFLPNPSQSGVRTLGLCCVLLGQKKSENSELGIRENMR